MSDKDPPIQEQEYIGGVKVVDFGDIRVARGLSRRSYTGCHHKRLVYDDHERRIWCKDCERDIDSFEAFKSMVENFHKAYNQVERIRDEAVQAQEHNLHLIATKNLEKVWRGRTMAVPCPHCNGGLLPEDFHKITTMTSAEIERQRRKK